MKNLKFRVHSPEHSEAIQKRLFELGYQWRFGGKHIKNREAMFLFCNHRKIITMADDEVYFFDNENQLATLEDLYKDDREQLTIKEVEERFNVKVIYPK
ncbi:hypothetical protein P12024L_44 [Nonlabens phage P12024L]|uniref:Uncharacterized protein n=1 Tax=Nonlabens phage P12024L TaxID=1168479 RepID=I6R9R8_9CAUD|nr:hypothetical protein B618_gp44 [Nonlabens phage P12024L]AFM54764.1 hypothetical protein P12024L_44 [Nonlabens phage P12024L]